MISRCEENMNCLTRKALAALTGLSFMFLCVLQEPLGQTTTKLNLSRESHGFDNIGCFSNGRAEASYTDGKIVHTGYVNKVGDFFADKK